MIYSNKCTTDMYRHFSSVGCVLFQLNVMPLWQLNYYISAWWQPDHKVIYWNVLFLQASETLGPIDILVNCAGFAVCGLFEETSVEDFKVDCSLIIKNLFWMWFSSLKYIGWRDAIPFCSWFPLHLHAFNRPFYNSVKCSQALVQCMKYFTTNAQAL